MGRSIVAVVLSVFAFFAFVPSVLGAPSESVRSVRITKAQYGKRWPFTVKSGVLACVGYSSVIFTTGGVTYAVNGTAMTSGRYASIRRIWRNDPALPGAKINIGPIIDRGLTLC